MTGPTSKSPRPQRAQHELANHELVVIAAYLAGAHRAVIDTEDIAVRANAIAPGRFTWRKYKDQINIDTVRKRLWDATKPAKGEYLVGSEKSGWRLTKAGYDFARKASRTNRLMHASKPRASQSERAAQLRELRRMAAEVGFHKIKNGQEHTLTKADAEHFFRLDDYVSGQARSAKIDRFRIIAARHPELAQAVEIMAAFVVEH